MLLIDPDSVSHAAGDTMTASITVILEKPVKARGLFATLVCNERKLVKSTVVLDKYDFERDKEMGQPYSSHMETKTEELGRTAYEQEKKICGERTFSGEEAFTVQFTIPKSAPPTSREFGHDNTIHIWKLRAKLDIPLALDENAEAEIFVEGI